MTIRFFRCLGADNLDGYRYTIVDLSQKPLEMSVDIYKNSDIYGKSKNIYLNGTQLTPYSTYNDDTLLTWSFNELSFIRTNPNGHIENSNVNTIEYK